MNRDNNGKEIGRSVTTTTSDQLIKSIGYTTGVGTASGLVGYGIGKLNSGSNNNQSSGGGGNTDNFIIRK